NLKQLLSRHDRQVESIVCIKMSRGEFENFRKDRAIRARLVEVVVSGAEVAKKSGNAANQRGSGFTLRVLGKGPVDTNMVVGIHRTREHGLAIRVDKCFCLMGADFVGDRRDASVFHSKISLYQAGM